MLIKTNGQYIQDEQRIEKIAKTIKQRFVTYGFKRVYTSVFEKYDLYSQVRSSINQNEMIKVIDHLNQVLVMRPDVTLPVTRQLAKEYSSLPHELRYYYIEDVYRKPVEHLDKIETTQAGVEYFCESSPEADAEVIALAIHMLKDLGFQSVKIELGHAGFFNEIIQALDISKKEAEQLKQLIRAKNIAEMEPFLEQLQIESSVKAAVAKIPFLYGNPIDVCEKARQITFTEGMEEKIDYFIELFRILEMYGVAEHVVMDLGLINHMDYYSGVIFQGFVENIGMPALMGGRYNQLGDFFHADLPAIGFACKLNTLMLAMAPMQEKPKKMIDAIIVYDEENKESAIKLATTLRLKKYKVIVTTDHNLAKDERLAKYKFNMLNDSYMLEDSSEGSKPSSIEAFMQGLK